MRFYGKHDIGLRNRREQCMEAKASCKTFREEIHCYPFGLGRYVITL